MAVSDDLDLVLPFLAGGGETGAIIRSQDWAATPLGEPQSWPEALRTVVAIMLGSNQPMFAVWGPEQTLLYNDRYSEILAAKHPTAMGRPFFEVWHEIVADLRAIMDRAYAGHPTQMDDIRLTMIRRGYPEETHFSFSYTPLRGPEGKVSGVFCPCQEITDKVKAERALRESEAKLRRLFDSAPASIAVYEGPDHVCTFSNPLHARSVGQPVIGRPLAETVPALAGEGVLERFDRVFRTGEPIVVAELPATLMDRGDGTRHEGWFTHVIQPWFGEDGSVAGVLSCAFDITEQVRAREALRESQEELGRERRFLRAVIENAPIGISIAEVGSDKPLLNELGRRMVGIDRFDGGLDRYRGLGGVHADGRPYEVDEYPTVRALRRGEEIRGEQLIFRDPRGDREDRRWLINSTPLRDEAGRITAAITAMIDVEERLRAEEHRTLLIDELNHRVKNTLAVVLALAEQTFRGESPEALETYEARIMALASTHTLLSRESWERASLGDVVNQALAVVDIGPGGVSVEGPQVSLQPKQAVSIAMALHELATNALKYGALSTADGRIVVRWRVADEAGPPGRLVLRWEERGGPRVVSPTHRGFGTQMVERALEKELDGRVRLDFAPEGVVCEIDAPLLEPRR